MRAAVTLAISSAFLCIAAGSSIGLADETSDLERRLADDQPTDLRLEAIEAATKLEREAAIAAIPKLSLCIGDKDSEIRIAALNAVMQISVDQKLPCPKAIIDGIFHKDPLMRQLASSYVGALTPVPAEYTPRLLDAIASEDPEVRANVSNSLATFGLKDKRTVPALRKATRDEVLKVRYNAFAALFKATRDYDSVLPFWLELADGYYKFSPPNEDGSEPVIFVDTLEKMHAMGAALSLRRAGRENPQTVGKWLLKVLSDKTARSRRSAASAMGMLAGDNPKTREALDKLAARDALVNLSDDADESVRVAAQKALSGFTRKVTYPTVPQEDPIVGVATKE